MLEEPVFMEIALADDVGNIIGKQRSIGRADARGVVDVPLEEFRSVAIGNPDIPKLLSTADGRPGDFAQVERFALFDIHIGHCEFAKYAIGEGVQRVAAWADIGNFERSIFGAFDPEFVMFRILLPIDAAGRSAGNSAATRHRIGRSGQTNSDIRHFGCRHKRVSKHELPFDRAAVPD